MRNLLMIGIAVLTLIAVASAAWRLAVDDSKLSIVSYDDGSTRMFAEIAVKAR
jgi:hypothetical protein